MNDIERYDFWNREHDVFIKEQNEEVQILICSVKAIDYDLIKESNQINKGS